MYFSGAFKVSENGRVNINFVHRKHSMFDVHGLLVPAGL
jgi:hypothetical protein